MSNENLDSKELPGSSNSHDYVGEGLQKRRMERPAETSPDGVDHYSSASTLELAIDSERSNGDFTLFESPGIRTPRAESLAAITEERTVGGIPMKDEVSAPAPDKQMPIKGNRESFRNLHKFSLYETKTRYYLVGGDITDQHFRMLKIDRSAPPGQLSIVDDDIVYSRHEMSQLLDTIEDGNKAAGGMQHTCKGWGLLGFIRFTEAYYMLMITKKEQVATVGGNAIFQVDDTELIPLTTGSSSRWRSNKSVEESRFLGILGNLDLHRSFYFSYSYNITRTLQHNIVKGREALIASKKPEKDYDFNDMLVWNHHLLSPAMEVLKDPYMWCVPIIHGFVDQSCVNDFGRTIYITLIARRSRFFAGARYLKRGSNDRGFVANDVETEQIVSDKLTTSFHAPGLRPFQSPTYTSFVQHRGSIPLYWTQENTGVTPKPAIDLNLIDPFYSAAALHFDNLFERYSTPIYVLNLVKARERTPRESKLLVEYQNAIQYLNQALPEGKKILYQAYDMSRASKTRGQDVVETLGKLAKEIVQTTGFFRNGDDYSVPSSVQNGAVRSNCIDCLDRTNAAQFIVGKEALACQLQALGVLAKASLSYDCDATNLFAHMFNDHGDTLASQYGGSHLVNTMETYRKINNWSSHSRDMLESFKRFYHNSFLDTQRQEAYNLFLGYYIFAQDQPMLWELPTDYYLHHTGPQSWHTRLRRSYIKWYTQENLQPNSIPPLGDVNEENIERLDNAARQWWHEYYRPRAVSSFLKVYAYRMNSTLRYLPAKPNSDGIDLSPFSVRRPSNDNMHAEGKSLKKDLSIGDSSATTSRPSSPELHIPSLQYWLEPHNENTVAINKNHLTGNAATKLTFKFTHQKPLKTFKPPDKGLMNQWTLDQFYSSSLNPSVTADEADEYSRYVSHPLNLPLVIHDDAPADANKNFVAYLGRGSDEMAFKDELIDGEAFVDYLDVPDNPLLVTEADADKKRYQAYRKWLRGKSLFKQSKVDPEYRAADEGVPYSLQGSV